MADSNEWGEQRDLTGQVYGDFRILRRLGQGGMGQVFVAEQISLKRSVALKFLKPELAANKTSLERFKREAEAVARTSHANIVQIYSIGDADGLHFMALEYVEGRNLREFIEKKGPPEVPLGLRIMIQVAAALQQASELGIVHRDIKPENILINRKGEVKVTDFGLSRHFKQDSNLTESRLVMGTPLYMSPEQVEGKAVDQRTDIYSFGVTCYHLFAGQPPFRGQSPFEVALQHVNKEPAPLAEIRPDLPADLCLMIHKMMAKLPEARYQTGREVGRDAQRLRDAFAASGGILSGNVLSGLTPSGTMMSLSGVESFEQSATTQSRRSARSRPWLFAGLLASALAVGAGVGWVTTSPPTASVAVAAAIPENKAQEPPALVKELFSVREREKELKRKIDEHLKDPLDRGLNLDWAMDYGVLLLRDRRLDEAEAFFKDLDKPERKAPQYKTLGHFGLAMTAAFRDRPAESNKLFAESLDNIEALEKKLEVLGKGVAEAKKDKGVGRFWRHHAVWRETMAQALNRNAFNAPDAFPADPRLDALRKPPLPTRNAPG